MSTLPPSGPSPTPGQLKLILNYAAEVRRFEIERFWQRSLFFWGFIGASLLAYATLRRDDLSQLLIASFGFLSSLAWALANRAGKYWHESWEQKVERYQQAVLGTDLFSRREIVKNSGILRGARYSASKLTIAMSDLSVILWLVLGLRTMRVDLATDISAPKVAIAAFTLCYAIHLLWNTRSTR